MSKRGSGAYRASWFPAVLFCLVPVLPAAASAGGHVAAAMVRQESYRHIHMDLLYTHAGDNRGFGPEHDLARANIFSQFQSFGLDVALEPFLYDSNGDSVPETYYNVVATKLGSVYPNQIYIVGAHYDSVNNPGADDNASGTALVIEAARVLSAFDSQYTIRFIAFDREEQGLIGSYNYVQAHLADDILGMISTDMVAYNTGADNLDILGRSASASHSSAVAAAVATYGGGLTATLTGPSNASDHAPFEWEGFPACLLIEDWGNPNYHTSRDNVDEPDYLDYAFATSATRSVVGFLVDQALVDVPSPNADYDQDGDVDLADYNQFVLCFSGPDTPPTDPLCAFFDLDVDGDVDCIDWQLFALLWTAPEAPPLFLPCNLLPPDAASTGGRRLTVTPPAIVEPVALLVTGDPADPAVACMMSYVQPDGSLAPTPFFQTAQAWSTVLVVDEQIVPDTDYLVWCDFGVPGTALLSEPIRVTTGTWGDTAGLFNGTEWPPPDGNVEIWDVVAILDKFQGLPGSPPMERVDLVGLGGSGITCTPDNRIDIVDAVAAVNAYQGFNYWRSTGCSKPCGN